MLSATTSSTRVMPAFGRPGFIWLRCHYLSLQHAKGEAKTGPELLFHRNSVFLVQNNRIPGRRHIPADERLATPLNSMPLTYRNRRSSPGSTDADSLLRMRSASFLAIVVAYDTPVRLPAIRSPVTIRLTTADVMALRIKSAMRTSRWSCRPSTASHDFGYAASCGYPFVPADHDGGPSHEKGPGVTCNGLQRANRPDKDVLRRRELRKRCLAHKGIDA